MELKKAFAISLKRARLSAKMSQEQLALASGIDRTFVSLLERGLRQPSLHTIFVLSKSLSLQPEEFIKQVTEVVDEDN